MIPGLRRSRRTCLEERIALGARPQHDERVEEPVISHRDVTTTMGLLADLQEDVALIRWLLEEEDGYGEEEVPEDDG